LCLTISAELPGLDEAALKDLVRAWRRTPPGIYNVSGRGLFGRGRLRLEMHACDMLSDDADPTAATWAMTPEGIEDLILVWRGLFDRYPGDVVAEAIFGGDSVEAEESVTRDEFLALVKGGALGTKTRYLVRPCGAWCGRDTPRHVAKTGDLLGD
jgi:hypothetical protein